MPMLVRKTQLLAKAETNEGTAETPGTADALLIFDSGFEPTVEMHERNPRRETLSKLITLAGRRSARMNFQCELHGSGTAGVAPPWGKLLKACGFAESISTGTSVTYSPASEDIDSLTLELRMDGVVKRIWGARGNVRLTLEGGKPGLLNFEFTGIDSEVEDDDLVSASYNATLPPVFLEASFVIDSYGALIERLEVNMNNELTLRPSVNTACGYSSVFISDRNPTATFDPEAVTVATKDFFSMWRTNAGVAMAATLGATAGNIIALSAPKTRLHEVRVDERAKIYTYPITALLAMNTGDDEFSITLT